MENPTEEISISMKIKNEYIKSYDVQIWLDSPKEEEDYLLNLEEERINIKYKQK